MLKRTAQTQALWRGKSQHIDNWLETRKQLLVEYCQLIGQKQDKIPNQLPDIEMIGHFCNHLVDYVSTGHFRIFDQMTQDCQNYQRVQLLIEELAPTTDAALDFYDRFSILNEQVPLIDFDHELNQLGEKLELRFSIEDQLLKELYQYIVNGMQLA